MVCSISFEIDIWHKNNPIEINGIFGMLQSFVVK